MVFTCLSGLNVLCEAAVSFKRSVWNGGRYVFSVGALLVILPKKISLVTCHLFLVIACQGAGIDSGLARSEFIALMQAFCLMKLWMPR